VTAPAHMCGAGRWIENLGGIGQRYSWHRLESAGYETMLFSTRRHGSGEESENLGFGSQGPTVTEKGQNPRTGVLIGEEKARVCDPISDPEGDEFTLHWQVGTKDRREHRIECVLTGGVDS
jgi:hypothetical protein